MRPILLLAAMCLGIAGCGDAVSVLTDDPAANSAWSGGDATVFDASEQAYSRPVPNLAPERLALHLVGAKHFSAIFVGGEAETNGGLGPVFNAASCVSCHPPGGRPAAPMVGGDMGSMLVRLSLPAAASQATGAPTPVPGFGGQLSDQAVPGVEPEASFLIEYLDTIVNLADGTTYQLREPESTIEGYRPPPLITESSARMPRPVYGLGLLEAVPNEVLLLREDELDRNGDRISGRPNYVVDIETGETVIGRFGWKANQPNLRQQAAGAYHDDMGITPSLFPFESVRGQIQDDGNSDDPGVPDAILDAVTFPRRRSPCRPGETSTTHRCNGER